MGRGAVTIHGLTRERLKELGAKPWPEHRPALEQALQGLCFILSYNLEFDMRLLQQTAKLTGAEFEVPDGMKHRCLMKDYALYRQEPHPWREGDFRWHRLAAAAEYEGTSPVQSHRALDDAPLALGLMRAVVADRQATARVYLLLAGAWVLVMVLAKLAC